MEDRVYTSAQTGGLSGNPQRESELLTEMKDLFRATDRLLKGTEVLRARLGPILRSGPVPETLNAAMKERATMTSIGGEIFSNRQKVNNACAMIEEIISLLEL